MGVPPNDRPGRAAEAALELLASLLILIGGVAMIATVAGIFWRIVVWAWTW